MLSEKLIQREIDSGLSAVCAWCEHHWATLRDGTTPGCQQTDCGGPLKGRAFPRYKGPRADLASYCFICGKDADMAVQIDGKGFIGCCDSHKTLMMETFKRKGGAVVVKERVVPLVRSDGEQ
jgi:hypothetical protein